MTFEEFFIKKKIDLAQLQRAKPALYEEFRSHYEQMGEKSFDHTKKYWFNRLRKDYRLTESAPVGTKADTPASTQPLASGALSGTAAPSTGLSSVSPSGFKPRFKPGTTKPAPSAESTENKPAESKSSVDEVPQKANAPAGFKPRFKSGAAKPDPSAESTENKPAESKSSVDEASPKTVDPAAETAVQRDAPEQASQITSPTGFKPRFKAGVTKPATPQEPAKDPESQTPAQPEPSDPAAAPQEIPEQTPAKPIGFKPRFKPGITKPAAPTEPTENKLAESKPPIEEVPQKANAPTGFKPRFKAGVTKPATPQGPVEGPESEKPDQPESSDPAAAPKEAADQTPAKPLGFKPRFKPGITNQKNEDNES